MSHTSQSFATVPDPTPRSIAEGRVIGLRAYGRDLLRQVRRIERRLAQARSFAEVLACDAELVALIQAHPLLMREFGA